MKPEQIEKLLDESFPANMPEGMRWRVLSRARQELQPAKTRIWRNLKVAFVCTVIALVTLANISDSARRTRIAGGCNESPELNSRTIASFLERQRLTQEAFASTDPWIDGRKERKPL